MEPENAPLEEENHLPNSKLSFSSSMSGAKARGQGPAKGISAARGLSLATDVFPRLKTWGIWLEQT